MKSRVNPSRRTRFLVANSEPRSIPSLLDIDVPMPAAFRAVQSNAKPDGRPRRNTRTPARFDVRSHSLILRTKPISPTRLCARQRRDRSHRNSMYRAATRTSISRRFEREHASLSESRALHRTIARSPQYSTRRAAAESRGRREQLIAARCQLERSHRRCQFECPRR